MLVNNTKRQFVVETRKSILINGKKATARITAHFMENDWRKDFAHDKDSLSRFANGQLIRGDITFTASLHGEVITSGGPGGNYYISSENGDYSKEILRYLDDPYNQKKDLLDNLKKQVIRKARVLKRFL